MSAKETVDPRTADIIIESLRAGEVPREGLEHFATGIDAHVAALEEEFARITDGRGRYRFLRGEYGAGKTFFLRNIAARARAEGFVATYVRVSYPEVPLHQPVAMYRAITSGLGVHHKMDNALRDLVDQWLYKISERVADPDLGRGLADDHPQFAEAMAEESRRMLGIVADAAPAFAQALDAYARASLRGDTEIARSMLQWLSGDDKVAASARKQALITGKLGHQDVLGMLRALSTMVTQAGYRGLVVLIDEVERLVKLPRSDSRKTGLELIQNWMGALDAGQWPHALMVVAGTTSFFDSPRGVPMLEPLQQRIGPLNAGPFPDMDAVQLRLPPFDVARLLAVGKRVRELYEVCHAGTAHRVSDAFLERLAREVSGAFGGKVEVTPRRYLREVVSVLSRVRRYEAFVPEEHYAFQLDEAGAPALSDQERAAREGRSMVEAEQESLPESFDL
ncbi:MAG: BREX system ATP-binding protein BrxD [Polyangiaceae bacterium]|nr:BREX system ATP-binding protein BrxD [Polyangiaceae bacterium]